MINFSSFLTEDKAGKNLHLEHIEDEILNYGVEGGRSSINFCRSLRDMLAGHSRSSINMTVKWDGAPAIFAGIDPEDGKFFVAKKSVFNVNPKLYKSNADIDADTSGDLNTKFKVALAEFPKLGIKGVLQGDLMFTSLETETIDGEKYYTFQPNTIVYAVPVNSHMGKVMAKAKIGVVWHTTYKGNALQDMKASFGADISKMKHTSSIWMDDASYKDLSGSATMNETETEIVTHHLSIAGKTFQKINATMLKKFLDIQNNVFGSGPLAGASLKTYNNSKVREGEKINNVPSHVKGYLSWVEGVYDKRINAIKTPAKKQEIETAKKEVVRELKKHIKNVEYVIDFQNHIVAAKERIVDKLNTVKQIGTFIRTKNGFKVTDAEGYVAIDRVTGGAVKLVDRMEFSFNNFTAVKAWDR